MKTRIYAAPAVEGADLLFSNFQYYENLIDDKILSLKDGVDYLPFSILFQHCYIQCMVRVTANNLSHGKKLRDKHVLFTRWRLASALTFNHQSPILKAQYHSIEERQFDGERKIFSP